MAVVKKRNTTKFIVIHCSATGPKADIGFKEIDGWHRAKGWASCGYHRIIRRNGKVENGRPLDEPGAHVVGYNAISVGVCMVGGVAADGKTPENNFTPEQFASLSKVVRDLKAMYPSAEVLGHRDLSPDLNRDGKITPNEWMKACPSFDARAWWAIAEATQ
jgi:N-acetyl-anhydromuramyl-L-alanine amidase AmpD